MNDSTEAADLPVVKGDLSQFGPVTVRPIQGSDENLLWKRLVQIHHYLGFGKLFGHQIKYFAFLGKTLVAALSFSAPALKLAPRDGWIGWSAEERRKHLGRIVNNSRFLILPNVSVKNLGSSLLGRALSRIGDDWENRFGIRPWMVESFVDRSLYAGTSYRAAGFLPLGKTAGFAKTKAGYTPHGHPKEIFLFVLDPSFRTTVGLMRPELLEPEVSVNFAKWAPDPEVVDGERLTRAEIAVLADQVIRFHEPYANLMHHVGRKRMGQAYLAGLMSNLERKSAEPIALNFLEGPGAVRSLQHFISESDWDEEELLRHYRRDVAVTIATDADSERSMLLIDSSEFPKQGHESVGVARQYCGRLGKVENCQSGVFLAYVGDKGHRLLDTALYLPKKWFDEAFRERREKTGVPKDLAFATKPEIAGNLIKKIVGEDLFPARWIGCDATFGMDRAFLDALPPDRWYFASVRSNLHVLASPPQWAVPERKSSQGKAPSKEQLTEIPRTLSEFAKTAPFVPVILKEGARGPMGAFLHASRIFRAPSSPEETPRAEWLIILRTLDGELRFALSNAPEDTTLETFAHVSTLRWSIERCFEEGKSHLGMGHYEHRSFRGWRRHMLYVFLAHHFLQNLRSSLKKKLRSLSPWPKNSPPPSFPRGLPPRKRFSYFTSTPEKETSAQQGPTGNTH